MLRPSIPRNNEVPKSNGMHAALWDEISRPRNDGSLAQFAWKRSRTTSCQSCKTHRISTHCSMKFRSQTSDNMDRWKSRGGQSQRREEQKREDQRRERERGKKMQVPEKVAKSRNTVFPMICGSGGSKSRLAKAAGGEPSGQMRDKKLHAVVAQSTFASEKLKTLHVRSTLGSWVRCWASVRRCCAKRLSFQVKMYKAHHARTTFGSWRVEKVCAVVARSTLRSQKCKKLTGSEHFWTLRCAFAWQAQGIAKVSKTWGFCSMSKTMAGVGHLKRVRKDAFSVTGAVQETCSSEMFGGQGADFLRGVAFWSMRSSSLLRWFCVTGATLYDLASLFRGRRNALEGWNGKIAKRIGTRLPGRQLFRIALSLKLSSSKVEGGSLAQLLRFWRWITNWGNVAE